MGLGFDLIAATRATPFWQNLLNAKQLAQPEMSFWLTRFLDDQLAQAEEPGGVLTLGGTNSSLYQGDIEFINFPQGVAPSFWLLSLTGASSVFT